MEVKLTPESEGIWVSRPEDVFDFDPPIDKAVDLIEKIASF